MRHVSLFVVLASLAMPVVSAQAQNPSGKGPPEFVSPEVSSDKKITFRIYAPNAKDVKLSSSDIPRTGTSEIPPGGVLAWNASPRFKERV